MSFFLPFSLFYGALVALGLWGAWLGYARSKSPTARIFVVTMALAWSALTAWGGLQNYRELQTLGGGAHAANTPVLGDAEQCMFCYEGPAGQVYVIAGTAVKNGDYRFLEPAHYSLRFEEGEVYVNGRRLDPGCHEGDAEAYGTISLRQARVFRLEVGEEAGCN